MHTPIRRAPRLWLMALVMSTLPYALMGCGRAEGDVEIEVCSDASVPDQIDSIRVSVLDAERQELVAGVRDLVVCPEDRLLTLPQTIVFDGVDAPDAWVVVQGLRDDVVVARFERRVALSTQESEFVRLGLTAACLGVTCPLGQTCVDGTCEVAPRAEPEGVCGEQPDPPEMGEEMDMQMPPAMDMGMPDMGEMGPPPPKYCPVEEMGGLL